MRLSTARSISCCAPALPHHRWQRSISARTSFAPGPGPAWSKKHRSQRSIERRIGWLRPSRPPASRLASKSIAVSVGLARTARPIEPQLTVACCTRGVSATPAPATRKSPRTAIGRRTREVVASVSGDIDRLRQDSRAVRQRARACVRCQPIASESSPRRAARTEHRGIGCHHQGARGRPVRSRLSDDWTDRSRRHPSSHRGGAVADCGTVMAPVGRGTRLSTSAWFHRRRLR